MDELEKQFYKDIQRIKYEVEMASSTYGILNGATGNEYDVGRAGSIRNTSTENRISQLLSEASPNLLKAGERNSIMGSIGAIGEDEFKRRTKLVLSEVISKEVAKKIKFTMSIDQLDQCVITKAKVYVFSEAEFKTYIEKLVNFGK